jgi:hypothetical protein
VSAIASVCFDHDLTMFADETGSLLEQDRFDHLTLSQSKYWPSLPNGLRSSGCARPPSIAGSVEKFDYCHQPRISEETRRSVHSGADSDDSAEVVIAILRVEGHSQKLCMGLTESGADGIDPTH